MASLDLKLEDYTGDSTPEMKTTTPVISTLKSKIGPKNTAYKTAGSSAYSDDKVFIILRDFLQPDSTLSVESATQSILDLLPENAPLSDEIWSFGEVCFELAEQIPYYHPSQLKFARLLEYIGRSTKVNQRGTSKGKSEFYSHYQRFGESMRDWLNGPESDNPAAWVNYNAFIANLHEHRIWPTDSTYAIWALRDALETNHENGTIRDSYILAGAQWILWYGQSLFKQVLFHGDVSSSDLQKWHPGPLYNGKPLLDLLRWRFWKDGFRAIAGEEGVSDECKSVAGKVAEMMDSFEMNLTF